MSQIIQLEPQVLVYKVPCEMLKQLPLKAGLWFISSVFCLTCLLGDSDTLSKLPYDPFSNCLDQVSTSSSTSCPFFFSLHFFPFY